MVLNTNSHIQLHISYPSELPVSNSREQIQRLIAANQVVIVCGQTGSGKTTQLPKMCLELGRGQNGATIVHTQPRRLAATATAKRIASELNSEVGQLVGYKIRFQDKSQENPFVKLVTDGILLAESQRDRLLTAYDTIIIDEAHERSLNIDLLLGYIKEILPKRPDLKLIITSATIDAERFANHFTNQQGIPAPVVEVSGRTYPVEVRYLDPAEFDQAGDNDEPFQLAALEAVNQLLKEESGDILFFLPGEREIREMTQFFKKNVPHHIQLLPLFARLSAKDQAQIFRSCGQTRVVLATNVAETSLTVPGIRFVIDSGIARVNRYSYRNKVEQLQIEPISKASANQRKGRCGRVANGICIRLYSEDSFNARAEFTDPEIFRSSLASVILRMKSLRLSEIEEFPFLQRPPGRAIADGQQLLSELHAINDTGQLTKTGQLLAHLPVDPRVARMLVKAKELACLSEVLVIASALSVQDPRERPQNQQEAADQAQQLFHDQRSDFLFYLKLWQWYQKAKASRKSRKALTDTLSKRFIHANRMREWEEVHTQLTQLVTEKHWQLNTSEATSEQIHLALLSGLLGNVGYKSDKDSYYLGARGIKFLIHPSSGLHKKAGKWVVVAELMETTKLYGRCVASIKPEWVEKMGLHLIQKHHTDPHWEKNSGQAITLENGTLYGLPIYSRRRVSLANYNRKDARTLLITEGLVPCQVKTNLEFYRHNCQLITDLENLEHKARRQNILVDETLIAQFYDQKIPAEVFNQQSLERWLKTASNETRQSLIFSKEDLLSKQADGLTTDWYPKTIDQGSLCFDLNYHFEPGAPRDGVTMTVPLLQLNQVNPTQCEWLVPGLLKDKVTYLLKSLPQKVRRHCVPVPQFAEKFVDYVLAMPRNHNKNTLLECLRQFVIEHTSAQPALNDFKFDNIPAHLFMNFKLVDEYGRQLDMQRSLASLKVEWGKKASDNFKQLANARNEGEGEYKSQKVPESSPNLPALEDKIVSWTFGDLPELMEINRQGNLLMGYPALKDCKTHCVLEVFDEPEMAKRVHFKGLIRLFSISLKENLKYLSKNFPDFNKISMMYIAMGRNDDLQEQWINLAIYLSALQSQWPRNEQEFNELVRYSRSKINLIAQEIGKVLQATFAEFQILQKKLKQQHIKYPDAAKDIENQVGWLFPADFLLVRPWSQLQHYPRYIKAAVLRLEKLQNALARDHENMREIQKLNLNWVRLQARLKGFEDPSMVQFAWQLQELRVSLFAQELKTPYPVSVKRLQKVWAGIETRIK